MTSQGVRVKRSKRRKGSGLSADQLKALFPAACVQAGVPKPVTEHRFWPGRRFAFDYAWPDQRVAVECEGGIWTHGRHTRGSGFARDLVKYSEAAARGWRLIRVQPVELCSPRTLEWVKRALSITLQPMETP